MSPVARMLSGACAVTALLAAAPAFAATAVPPITQLVGGTAHQALFAVATDGRSGIAVGDAGAILERNPNETWHPVTPPPTALGLLGVAMNGGHAIAVGQMGTVFLRDTVTGPWRAANSGTTNRLFAVALNAHGNAVAVGAFGTALRSDDFGATWHAVAPDWDKYTKDGQQPHLYDAAIDESGTMTIAGEFGLILRSTDGKSWVTLHTGDASIFAMNVSPDGGGFAVGQNGLVLRTGDGGTSWQQMDAGTTAILLGVRSTGDGHVIASAMHDMLTSDDNGTSWRHVPDNRFAASWYQGIADLGTGQPWLVAGHSGELIEIGK